MGDVKWIKITTNVFDDEKIRLIETLPDADTLIVIWFKLLIMAGKCNDCGFIYLNKEIPYNDEMLSTIMRRPINTIRLALVEFVNLKMIEIEDDYISISNWDKHQNIEGLEKIKEQGKVRQQRHRDKLKQLPCNVTDTLRNETDKNRTDKNRTEENKDSKILSEDLNTLLQSWNSLSPLPTHKPETLSLKIKQKRLKTHINECISIYGVDIICKSFKNYSEVLESKSYYWSHKWSLWDFMVKGLDRFIDEADPFDNFKSKNKDSSESARDTFTPEAMNRVGDYFK